MAEIRVIGGGKGSAPAAIPPSQWFCMCVEEGWPHFTVWQGEPEGQFYCLCTRCLAPMSLPPEG